MKTKAVGDGLLLSLLQVALWQKAKAPDHRSALVATLGPTVVVNLLPCHHRQEQPEVCSGVGGNRTVLCKSQLKPTVTKVPMGPLGPICLKHDTLSLNQQKAVYAV